MAQYLRALLQPAPIFGLAIIAIFWVGLLFVLPDAHGQLAGFEHHRSIYFAAAAVLTLLELITIAAGIRRQLSLEKTNLRFDAALENMTHGLCMFDGDKRLVISNERYASLYRLPPELLKPGTSARSDHRPSCHQRHPQGRQQRRRRGQKARRARQAFGGEDFEPASTSCPTAG